MKRDPETRAAYLLARMDAGDVAAVTAYADLALALGWPCYGYPSWSIWALVVRADLAERARAVTGDPPAERLPVCVDDQVYQGALL